MPFGIIMYENANLFIFINMKLGNIQHRQLKTVAIDKTMQLFLLATASCSNLPHISELLLMIPCMLFNVQHCLFEPVNGHMLPIRRKPNACHNTNNNEVMTDTYLQRRPGATAYPTVVLRKKRLSFGQHQV